ncbi:2-octaprenyl-6-methoxyphenyl hydroxylase, partial [Salmonella enterica subsp. enterica serovar Montevideo]|nr:2-octaprenyl-6-methoxyphenyl hydroxylase [Salmonella enterica subsp. enterica serovar Montevideo]
ASMLLLAGLVVAFHVGREERAGEVLSNRADDRAKRKTEERACVTNGLVHLFANRWAPLVIGRNIGLMAMELLPPARDALAQRT